MSKFVRGTVLSGVLASLLLVPAMGAAQGRTSVKVGKDGNVHVKAGDTEVKTGGADDEGEQLGGADVEEEEEEAKPSDAKIEISGAGAQETHRCSKSEVEISGDGHDVTLTGECKSVSVNGSNNKVKVEAVAAIEVAGANNAVTWKKTVGGKKPKVSRSGAGNKVTQEK